MEIKQRDVIKFFIDEGMKSLDILLCLHKHYGHRAFTRPTLYFWTGEARRARTDRSETPEPGKTPDKGLVTVIPDDMNKIPICPRKSWPSPSGSRPRLYATICPTSWD
jgi:hypothetical protein